MNKTVLHILMVIIIVVAAILITTISMALLGVIQGLMLMFAATLAAFTGYRKNKKESQEL